MHTFADCDKVKLFWENLKAFISKVLNKTFTLTTAEVIFGKFGVSNLSANFCILYAKWYIHLNKSQNIISFHYFKDYLKNVFVIEEKVYVNKGKKKHF